MLEISNVSKGYWWAAVVLASIFVPYVGRMSSNLVYHWALGVLWHRLPKIKYSINRILVSYLYKGE